MAQLSNIVCSILRDMVYAQHQANMYAVSLEDVYRKNGRLENFAMPAIALGEMELNIRYGITDSSAEVEQFEINYPALRDTAKKLSQIGARLLLDSAIPILRQSFPESSLKGENYFENLDKDLKLRRDFGVFLSHKILKKLQMESTSIINNDGTPNTGVLKNIIMDVGMEHLLHKEEVEELFDRYGREETREQAQKTMETAIEQGLPAVLHDVNLKRKRLMPSVDVVVTAEELAKLPEEAIHTLHFKISPSNINLYMKDE